LQPHTHLCQAHAGALQNILREASQPVPDALTKFGSTVKKKEHKLYGAYGPKEGEPMKTATKIVFGD
jgi:ATP-dependent RNA helicase DBP3